MNASAPPGFCSTAVVGEVLFHILGVSDHSELPTAMKVAAPEPAIQVWPPSQDIPAWPPWTIYMDDSLESFCVKQVWRGAPPSV
jgi:hypothetical protein